MEGKYVFGSAAICSLAAIECVALYNGVDGPLMSAIVGAIMTIVGALIGVNIAKKSE